MTWPGRWVPPVYAPLSLGTLWRGAAAVLGGGASSRRALRDRLTAFYGADDALLTDSGTTALSLALRAACPGGCALLPAYGCFDLATAAIGAGVRVHLYDLDPDTLAPDAASLARGLASGPGALVLVHPFGIPLDAAAYAHAAARAGAVLIEDAAQAFGARRDGRPAGGVGPLTVLSFGRGKGLSGCGGGALLGFGPGGIAMLRDAARELGEARRGAAQLGGAAAQWVLGRPSVYGLPRTIPWLHLGETRYRPPAPGRGIPASSAAMVLAGWRDALDESARRRDAAGPAADLFDGAGIRVPVPGKDAGPSWLRLPFLLPTADARRAARGAARLGIEGGYPLALCDLPALRGALVNPEEPLAGARALARRLFTAPVHGGMTAADGERLAAWIRMLSRERPAAGGTAARSRSEPATRATA